MLNTSRRTGKHTFESSATARHTDLSRQVEHLDSQTHDLRQRAAAEPHGPRRDELFAASGLIAARVMDARREMSAGDLLLAERLLVRGADVLGMSESEAEATP